jgi:2-hydroxy-6-oxonona-2,4-dienedioate hydrolase
MATSIPSVQLDDLPQKPVASREARGVRELTIPVLGQAARVFAGGQGEVLLLIHGGWGGAAMHWGAVWERLAERFHVVAPDLPGIGRTDQRALGSVGAYAAWIDALMTALELPHAWCVGNSFGASVACRLASDHPARCRGLVLVNGIPIPPTPPLLRKLGERPLGRRLLRILEANTAYSPSALKRAFFDRARAPEELRSLVHSASPPQIDAFVDILVQGGSPPPRDFAPLLLWGEEDHLLGTSADAARKLRASWPGAELAFVAKAGHMPQVENPAAFVEALVSFVEAGAARAH